MSLFFLASDEKEGWEGGEGGEEGGAIEGRKLDAILSERKVGSGIMKSGRLTHMGTGDGRGKRNGEMSLRSGTRKRRRRRAMG